MAALASGQSISTDVYGASEIATVRAWSDMPSPAAWSDVSSPVTPYVEWDCQLEDIETIMPGNSVACAYQGPPQSAAENGVARRWEDAGGKKIVGLRYGVEACRDVGGVTDCPITIKVYTGTSFPTRPATADAEVSDPVPVGTASEVREVSLATPLEVPAGEDLVVEIHNPNGLNKFAFWTGSNTSPETSYTYLWAPACGISVWTPTKDVGDPPFPDMHVILCHDGGGGGPSTGCEYEVSKNSKAKKGCTLCYKKHDKFMSGEPCEKVKDCDRKIKEKTYECLEPEDPGFCKKLKAKRSDCIE